jgi:hypothetical protein
MKSTVKFPKFFTDQAAISLICKLLNKNVQQRGAGGFEAVKNSTYFENFAWRDLEEGNIPPPFVPRKFRNESFKVARLKQMEGYPLSKYLGNSKDQNLGKFEPWTNEEVN